MTEFLVATDLVTDYEKYKEQRVGSRSVANANWVTTLAHPCEAYAIYMRTVPPDKRAPLKKSLGMIFSEGDDQARAIKRDLLDMGYDVEGAEGQVSWPLYQITGRQDLKIRKHGVRHGVFAEIKSCSPFTYDSINSVDDLRLHKWTFIQKWFSQVCLYMVLKSVERYWMILKNKTSGQIKIIEFTLGERELQQAEEMLRKAERVNEAVKNGDEPEDSQKLSVPETCQECEFFNVCLPDMDFGNRAQFIAGEQAAELQKMLERRAELKDAAKEFGDLDDDLKDTIKSIAGQEADHLVIGDWIASIKRQEVKAELTPRKAFTKRIISFTKPEAPHKATE
jgi:hypothetical protein